MTGSLEHNPGLLDDAVKAEVVLYQSDGSNVPVEVRYLNETFWLTQREMADLFDVNHSVITKHLRNVFEEGELEKESTSANIALVRAEGSRQVKRQVEIYNLDAIIAVGYRVNSLKATRFRQWATRTLREYIAKGFVLNDDMLKNGAPEGRIHSSDVSIAKNYLTEEEITRLNRLVTRFLDDLEDRAADQVLTSMRDCADALDALEHATEKLEVVDARVQAICKELDSLAGKRFGCELFKPRKYFDPPKSAMDGSH